MQEAMAGDVVMLGIERMRVLAVAHMRRAGHHCGDHERAGVLPRVRRDRERARPPRVVVRDVDGSGAGCGCVGASGCGAAPSPEAGHVRTEPSDALDRQYAWRSRLHRMTSDVHRDWGLGPSDGSRLLRCRLMTVDERLTRLAALPAVQKVASGAPIVTSIMVAGIEVAAVARMDEPALRRAWRDRHRGGPTPRCWSARRRKEGTPSRCWALSMALVLSGRSTATPSSGCSLGPQALLDWKLCGSSQLNSTGLIKPGSPGLTARELLTDYTLRKRLREDVTRWSALAAAADPIPPSAEWRATATALGYEVEQLPRRGWLWRHAGRPVAVVHPKADQNEFARLDDQGRPPEGLLLNHCAHENAPFGLLASGSRLRLFRFDPGTGAAAARYIDLDVQVLRAEDRPYLGLCARVPRGWRLR